MASRQLLLLTLAAMLLLPAESTGTSGGASLAATAASSLGHFPGSRIVTNSTWGGAVNTWAKKPAAQVWSLCYSSFTDNRDNALTFHKQCDRYSSTMVFAVNSLNYTFGGYAAGSWSKDACCAFDDYNVSTGGFPNSCSLNFCTDRHQPSDFLFRLQPGEPWRFRPIPHPEGNYEYQSAYLTWWPQWGGGPDLILGYDGPPGGDGGWCNQGDTYAGSPNEACGGGSLNKTKQNWGHTEVEAWYLAEGV